MIEQLLKNHNMKITAHRVDILETIMNLDNKSTIKNICKSLPDIDKSTIYRNIEILEDSNIIIKIVNGDSEIAYELKGRHRHYLNCIKCKTRRMINYCTFEEEELDGFIVLDHTLIVDGICEKCQKKDNN